jgi:thiol-disulfide isomerase/thioredoxin
VAVALVAAACSGGDDTSETPEPAASEVPGRGIEAPDFAGELLTGEALGLDALVGEPLIVNFWATTCEPCIREMPALAGAAKDHAAEGLKVVGVNFGEPVELINGFLDDFEIDLGFPIMLDPIGEVSRSYKVIFLPTTYFIDRDGTIQYRRIGELGDRHLAEGLSRIM